MAYFASIMEFYLKPEIHELQNLYLYTKLYNCTYIHTYMTLNVKLYPCNYFSIF